MEEIIQADLSGPEAAHLRELVVECVEKIKQARERMAEDQTEIEQYRAETRAVIERLRRKAG
jgi:hypothetical protein